MFRPKKKKISAEVPSSAMADVAFLMLFFFLCTTKFDQKYGLGIVLPELPKEEQEIVKLKDENLTRILISTEGQVTINGEPITLNDLEAQVRTTVIQNPLMVFMLRTDRQSKYVNMVDVLDRLRLAGATKISLSTN